MALYHREIGFPKGIQIPQGLFFISYSLHAKREAESDRYGSIKFLQLPPVVNLKPEQVFEIEVESGKIIKFLCRIHYDSLHDLVLAINPFKNLVVTVWLNSKDDIHSTLVREKYETNV